jgi:hypothetical protein
VCARSVLVQAKLFSPIPVRARNICLKRVGKTFFPPSLARWKSFLLFTANEESSIREFALDFK